MNGTINFDFKLILEFVISKWCIIIAVLLMIIAVFRIIIPYIKGWLGENALKLILKELPKSRYKVFNDVIFKTSGASIQIDHIVVSKYAVFVIENKNYKGTIIGSEKPETWTQKIGKSEFEFYNPIKQNQIHINYLQSIIKFEIPIVSIIAFSPRGKLDVNTDTIVVPYNKVKSQIKQYRKAVINKSERDEICGIIEELDKSSLKTHISHAAYVKKVRHNIKSYGKCPKCGKDLVKRKSQYGEFLGCSGYPNCKFTKSIK